MSFPVYSTFWQECLSHRMTGSHIQWWSNQCWLNLKKHGSTEDNSEVVTSPATVLHRYLSPPSPHNSAFSAGQAVCPVCSEREKHWWGQHRSIHVIYRGGGGGGRFYWWQRGGGAVSAARHCRSWTGSTQVVHRPPWCQVGKQEAAPNHRWGARSVQLCPQVT